MKASVSDTALAALEDEDKLVPDTDEQLARRKSFSHRRSKSGSAAPISDKQTQKDAAAVIKRAATEHPLRKADSASDVNAKTLRHRRQESTTSIDSNGDPASSTYSRWVHVHARATLRWWSVAFTSCLLRLLPPRVFFDAQIEGGQQGHSHTIVIVAGVVSVTCLCQRSPPPHPHLPLPRGAILVVTCV